MRRYNPKEIEPKWQAKWSEEKLYKAVDFDDSLPKYVMLTEFPYPSGDGLHLGHVREYTLGDIIARHKRMTGHNVLYPMGYDEFGLPTENYAIKHKIAPATATQQNVSNFQKQFESLGYSIDWDRKVRTSDPDYYKWTQWLFLQFFKAGLAYQDEIDINWCPKCKTGLANEEVVNGRHERCDTIVEKKTLKQWLLKITEYADRLIDGLKEVDFPSRIADQQINWIGRSRGATIKFDVKDSSEELEIFTTRHDTQYGVTFVVVAPEHPLLEKITTTEQKKDVGQYVKESLQKTELDRQEGEKDKTGVFTGAFVINPANGQEIPVWVADYVLMGYGTGAVMGVPGHDDRDNEFARKYGLEIKKVLDTDNNSDFHSEGVVINSGPYNGMRSEEMREKILDDFIKKGVAKETVLYRLRDWIFSRQHYWGEPIPIIHCEKCGAVAVPDKDLPVKLPKVDNYEPTDTGESPLAEIPDWVNVDCPKCSGPAKRETDTMPNWAGSSWYYLRYFDPNNDQSFAERSKLDYWGMVDLYLGGMEHTTLHLLYSRFWHQFFYDQGLVPTREPYAARRGQGIILAPDGKKMSKSLGNVINPTDVIESGYGADALRMAIAFLAPYDQTTPWNPEGVAGTHRFLNRVWVLVHEYLDSSAPSKNKNEQLLTAVHRAIKKVSQDLYDMSFNTAIASLMGLVNELYKIKAKDNFSSDEWQTTLNTLVKIMAPFAPHIADELWNELGNKGSVHVSDWPVHDELYLKTEKTNVVVQVNGKVRATIQVEVDSEQVEVERIARDNEKIQAYIKNGVKKVIYIPNKLLNFVV